MQFILRQQIEALISKCGVTKNIRNTVFEIFFKYTETCITENVDFENVFLQSRFLYRQTKRKNLLREWKQLKQKEQLEDNNNNNNNNNSSSNNNNNNNNNNNTINMNSGSMFDSLDFGSSNMDINEEKNVENDEEKQFDNITKQCAQMYANAGMPLLSLELLSETVQNLHEDRIIDVHISTDL